MNRSVIVILLLTVCVSGCGSLLRTSASLAKAPARALSGLRKQPHVSQILCLWEPAEGQGLDGKPARGFAGQIIFTGYGQRSPVRVHGKVRIFEYINYDPNEPEPVPAHLFEFDDGGWNAHLHDGTLGYTYNVFLPYVGEGNNLTVCALRVEFESEDGRKVTSPFTEVTLPVKPSAAATRGVQRGVVRTRSNRDRLKQLSETRLSNAPSVPPEKLESTTIKLPRKKP